MLSFGLTYYLCVFGQLLYPTYASYKALMSFSKDDDTQWLVYWTVNAFISTLESLAAPIFNWIPLYYEIKFLVLIWMVAPQTQGAKFLFEQYIRPFLEKHASKIDPVFKRTEQALNTKYVGMAAQLVQDYGPDVAEAALKNAKEQAQKLAAAAVAAQQQAAKQQ